MDGLIYSSIHSTFLETIESWNIHIIIWITIEIEPIRTSRICSRVYTKLSCHRSSHLRFHALLYRIVVIKNLRHSRGITIRVVLQRTRVNSESLIGPVGPVITLCMETDTTRGMEVTLIATVVR